MLRVKNENSNLLMIEGSITDDVHDISGVVLSKYNHFQNASYKLASISTRNHHHSYLCSSSNEGELIFSTSAGTYPEERMRISHDGKIGIGKSNPQHHLDIEGDVNITGNYYINGNVIATQEITVPWIQNDSNIYFLSSNIGIHTSNPQFPLHVDGELYASVYKNLPLYISSNQQGVFSTNSQSYLNIIHVESSNTTSGTYKIQCVYDYIPKTRDSNYINIRVYDTSNDFTFEKEIYTKDKFNIQSSDMIIQEVALSNPCYVCLSVKTSSSNDFVNIANSHISIQKVFY